MTSLVSILVFPGVIFLMAFSLAAEYIDRKVCAKLQNRVGPPWFQPLADFIKLCAKQDVMPEQADKTVFRLMPLLAFAAVVAAFLYIPIWGTGALASFDGDLIVVLYLLTIPTITFFLAGWYSGSNYSMLGAVRAITQLFAYEVPLFLSVLAPALLAGTWSLSEMSKFYSNFYSFSASPWHWLVLLLNLPGFAVSLIAMLGKLEKVPFDIPEAETEIVAGSFTEYAGRLLAMFRMAIDVEMVVGASLIAAVFMPFGLGDGKDFAILGFVFYLVKVLFVVVLLSILRTIMARMRIDQMINFCWKVVAPIAFAQLLIDLIIKGVISQ
jgi:NADH-quinone oxidoreductase subunit H